MDERSTEPRIRATRTRAQVLERVETAQLRQPPDFIIIGTQKGGTTSLHRYLSGHPDIGVSIRGEDHFFSWRYDEGLDWNWYLARFPLRGEVAVVAVSSPSYLFHPRAAERIHAALPRVRLAALLRNPIDRAYSQHQMNFRKGIEPLSFEDAIAAEPERLRNTDGWVDQDWRKGSHVAYLTRGLYAEQLRRWLTLFPREQLLILKSEDFFQRPAEGIQRTLEFLDLPVRHPDNYQIYNPGEYDQMHPETRARLREYFAPHNQQLYELLGFDFGWELE